MTTAITNAPFRRLAKVSLVAVAGHLGEPEAVAQDTFTWTGGAGNTTWTTASNWAGPVVDYPRDDGDTALFAANAAVTGGATSVLTINPGAVVTFGSGTVASTTVSQAINNNGTIGFFIDASDQFSTPDQAIRVAANATVTLGGTGTVQARLDAGFFGQNASTLTHQAGHQIIGLTGAHLSDLTFNNNAPITINAGTFRLSNINFNNTSAVTLADGTMLELNGASVAGGTVVTTGTTRITSSSGSTLSNLTLSGTFNYGNGSSSQLNLMGTIINNGVFRFLPDTVFQFGSPDQALRVPGTAEVPASATLAGTGSVIFNGDTGYLGTGSALATLTQLAGHTTIVEPLGTEIENVTHSGEIESITLVNQGTVRLLPDAILWISASTVTNTVGLFELGHDSLLQLFNSTFTAGAIRGNPTTSPDNSGRLYGGTLADVTLDGDLRIGSAALAATVTTFSGLIQNDANLTFAPDTVDHFSGPDQEISVPANSTTMLAGVGTLTLNGDTGIDGSTASGLINSEDHTITTTELGGEIRALGLENRGVIRADAGGLLLIANVQMDNAAGELAIAQHSAMDLSNSTVTGGTLTGSANARLVRGTLMNMVWQGAFMVGDSASTFSRTTVQGTITNNASVLLTEDTATNFSGPDQELQVPSDLTFLGTGSITLNGDTGFESDQAMPPSLINGPEHTIASTALGGEIRNLMLLNQGTIRPAGPLVLNSTATFDQTMTGVIDLQNGTLSLPGSPDIEGEIGGNGLITATAISHSNGTINPASDLAFTGALLLGPTTTLEFEIGTDSDLISVAGNLTLDGVINVTAGAGFTDGVYPIIDYAGTLTDNGLAIGSTPAGTTLGYGIQIDSVSRVVNLVIADPPILLSVTSRKVHGP